jgi:hypothetical protein
LGQYIDDIPMAGTLPAVFFRSHMRTHHTPAR